MTETQIREQKIYDYFQSKALREGITTAEFEDFVEKNEITFIQQPRARFRKITVEFSDLLTKEKVGKMCRYFLPPDFDGESLYYRHIGLRKLISDNLGKKGFVITYRKNNSLETENTVVFFPEYKRIYNDRFYIYGVAIDLNGNRYDIAHDKIADVKFTQMNINLITNIKESPLDFKPTFSKDKIKQWDSIFEYVLGVDPILNREPEDILLYVKKSFSNRFETQPLYRFFVGYEQSDVDGYNLLKLQVKQNRELERCLLAYGDDVIVKSPNKLRNVIAKEIKKLNEYYNG
jgi:hypothetical protein